MADSLCGSAATVHSPAPCAVWGLRKPGAGTGRGWLPSGPCASAPPAPGPKPWLPGRTQTRGPEPALALGSDLMAEGHEVPLVLMTRAGPDQGCSAERKRQTEPEPLPSAPSKRQKRAKFTSVLCFAEPSGWDISLTCGPRPGKRWGLGARGRPSQRGLCRAHACAPPPGRDTFSGATGSACTCS